MYPKVQHAFTLLEIAHAKLAEFFPAHPMVQQRGEDGTVTFAFEGVGWWCFEEHARLFVTECRREAFTRICYFRPFHALHGTLLLDSGVLGFHGVHKSELIFKTIEK